MLCIRKPWSHRHLGNAVQPATGTLGLVLGTKLQLLLLLLEVNQVPLVLETGLPPLPELQEQGHCKGDGGGLGQGIVNVVAEVCRKVLRGYVQ